MSQVISDSPTMRRYLDAKSKVEAVGVQYIECTHGTGPCPGAYRPLDRQGIALLLNLAAAASKFPRNAPELFTLNEIHLRFNQAIRGARCGEHSELTLFVERAVGSLFVQHMNTGATPELIDQFETLLGNHRIRAGTISLPLAQRLKNERLAGEQVRFIISRNPRRLCATGVHFDNLERTPSGVSPSKRFALGPNGIIETT